MSVWPGRLDCQAVSALESEARRSVSEGMATLQSSTARLALLVLLGSIAEDLQRYLDIDVFNIIFPGISLQSMMICQTWSQVIYICCQILFFWPTYHPRSTEMNEVLDLLEQSEALTTLSPLKSLAPMLLNIAMPRP